MITIFLLEEDLNDADYCFYWLFDVGSYTMSEEFSWFTLDVVSDAPKLRVQFQMEQCFGHEEEEINASDILCPNPMVTRKHKLH